MAGTVRVITINENIMSKNESIADRIRADLSAQGTLFLNFMSSPGSGKTTILTALINRLKKDLRIAEMDVDIKTSIDAQRVADATGIRAMQINNGGLCHIDADMTSRAIEQFGVADTDLLILENIGNLVCPAEFDTGAHLNINLLSIPEGDDKPLKYPLMFQVCDVIIFNKIDTLPAFNFDMEKAKQRILALNPKAKFFAVSAKTGEGMDDLADWVRNQVAQIQKA